MPEVTASPKDYKSRLINAIKTQSLRYGDFTLKSGQKALFYLDLRTVTISADVRLITPLLNEALLNVEFDAIGGPSLGADPIVGAFLQFASFPPQCRGFLVRKEEKGHGVGGLVIGSVRPGDRCVVVEDVTTTAGSLAKAIRAVHEYGCDVVKAVAVVDRSQREGHWSQARNWLERQENVPFMSILTLEDLGMDSRQILSLQYMDHAIELARLIPLDGEPWSWTEPASTKAIELLLEQYPSLKDSLNIWSKDGTVYKISIRPEVYKE